MRAGTITAAGFVAVLGAIALNAKPLIDAAAAGWAFLGKATSSTPLGLGAFLIALGLATASQPFLRRVSPLLRCAATRELLIQSAALVIAVAAMWLLMQDQGPKARLYALLLGAFAGFVAPYLFLAIQALIGLAWRALSRPSE